MSTSAKDLGGLIPIHTNFGSNKDDLVVVEYDVPQTKVKQTLFFKYGQLSIPKWALIPASILAFGLLTALCAVILNSILAQPNAIVTYSQECSKISKCKDGVGLYCGPGNRCTCPSTQYWYEGRCTAQPTYTESCNQTTECRTDLGLVCAELDALCNCPNTTEVQTCDCLSTAYWTGSMCTPRSTYHGVCSVPDTSYQCLYNLYCNGTQCICAPYTQYWNATANSCFSIDKYLAACDSSTSYSCDTTVFLTCQTAGAGSQCPFNATAASMTCDCLNGTYWNGGSCVSKKTYGSDCYQDCECDLTAGLLCRDLVCACPDKYYWSTLTSPASCQAQKDYGEKSCTNTSQCDTNQGLTCYLSGTACNCPNTSTVNMCDCLSTQYYDNVTSACQTRLSYDSTCYADYMCDTSLGLFCQLNTSGVANCSCPWSSRLNMCDCNLTSYWDGTACVLRMGPNATCTNDYECQSGYICLVNETDNGYFSDVCRCPIGQYYVNGSGCIPSMNYSDPCVGSYQCYEPATLFCRYNYTGLTCLTVVGIPACDCADNYYYNASQSQCLPRMGRFEACQDDCQCTSAYNCTSGLCDCTFYYSSLTQSCVRYLAYGDACTTALECADTPNAFMTCSNVSTCACNSSGYWNGSQCVFTDSFRAVCTSDANCQGDLRCQTLTCLNSTKRCSCPSKEFYSFSNKTCIKCDGNAGSGFDKHVVNFEHYDACVAMLKPDPSSSRTFADGMTQCGALTPFGSSNTPQLISLNSSTDPNCLAVAMKTLDGGKKCNNKVYYLGWNSSTVTFLDGTIYYSIFSSPIIFPPSCLTVCLTTTNLGSLAASSCNGKSASGEEFGYICDYRVPRS